MYRLSTIFFVLCICIASVVCQPCCPQNSTYTPCGSSCPERCYSPLNPRQACTKMCVDKCSCIDGYLLTLGGKCVLPDDCPGKIFNKIEVQ